MEGTGQKVETTLDSGKGAIRSFCTWPWPWLLSSHFPLDLPDGKCSEICFRCSQAPCCQPTNLTMLNTKLTSMKWVIHSSRIEKPFPEIGCNHCPQSTNSGPTLKMHLLPVFKREFLESQHNYENIFESIIIINKHKKSKIWQCHQKGKWFSIHLPSSSLEKITANFVIFYVSSEINFRSRHTSFWKLQHCFKRQSCSYSSTGSDSSCVDPDTEGTLSLRYGHWGDVVPTGPFPSPQNGTREQSHMEQ